MDMFVVCEGQRIYFCKSIFYGSTAPGDVGFLLVEFICYVTFADRPIYLGH